MPTSNHFRINTLLYSHLIYCILLLVPKHKLKKLAAFLILSLLIIKFVLLLQDSTPTTIDEAQRAYFSFSIFKIKPELTGDFWSFGKEQGYLLFWLPIVFLKLLFLFLPLSTLSLRISSLILSFLSSFFFALSAVCLIKHQKKQELILFSTSFLIFFLSPWQNFLATFSLPANLTIFFVTFSVFAFLKREKNRFFSAIYPISLVLAGFTGWPGLIFSSTFLLFSNRRLRKFSLIGLILLICLLYLNKTFVRQFLETSFLNHLRPERLAFEINERQRIDFLAVERKFILPYGLRKLTYNKPALALNKVVSQAVSFFDFEQFASPLDSYQIIRLSGLVPKGNPILGYIWEIPLVISGLYLLLRNKKMAKEKVLLLLFCSGFASFLLFEKKLMVQSAFILLPLILILETLAIFNFVFKKPILSLLFPLFLLGIINYHYRFFYQPQNYLTSHPFLFREIGYWLKENKTDKDIIITTRFGSTHLMTAFYLEINPNLFWPEYLNNKEEKTFDHLHFKTFQVSQDRLEAKTVYIGLIGEFVKPGKYLEQRKQPNFFHLIKTISAEDETVFNYGNSIWIGYFNK